MMKTLYDYDLYLLDFDGLLVNTEHIHHQAYVNILNNRGFTLDWSFLEFCQKAHFESEGLQEAIYQKFPDLQQQEPSWKILYEEKKKAYTKLLTSAQVQLMPGVEQFLLQLKNKITCVVTNSLKEHTDLIKASQPILHMISHWITREDYNFAKPHPECYLRAIQLYGAKAKKIIGFEDTIKGIKALVKTPAHPVLISPHASLQLEALTEKGITYFSSLEKLLS
jgi:beta-phosphoglucomutase